ncbi:30S ribosomal protein S12-B, chloroplastic [Quillaja saponaria]|uniref:30S ribosomal protein S12-B, chloroplastic n=1 Tax=Quillaja saponaria TaxID=32244 RepID=A0AAD7KMG9_QUISA|nr:30S ribosomal protein S12-B, chloroplastic [Quillaja saponaria]
MLIPQIPSLLLLREKKFTTVGLLPPTRHWRRQASPIGVKIPHGCLPVVSLGPCLSPQCGLIILFETIYLIIAIGKLLPQQLANQTRAPPRMRIPSSFAASSAYGVLKHKSRFQLLFPLPRAGSYGVTHPSALETPLPVRLACVKHAASVHPEPDRTLHEIHSCITYSFLVRRQS